MSQQHWNNEVSHPGTVPLDWAMYPLSDGFYVKKSDGTVLLLSNGLPAGHLFGMVLSNNGTDPTNDIDVSAGKCRSDDDTEDIVLASSITKQLDAVWAVGTNAGGRASGAGIANATYHVFVIKRTDTRVVDVAFDSSPTGANIAANTNAAYTKKRRVGSISRVSNAIRLFKQDDDNFEWLVPVNDVNVTNPGTAAVTRTLTVPTGIRVQAKTLVIGEGNGADQPINIFISDLSITDTPATLAAAVLCVYASTGGTIDLGATVLTYTNTSAQIRSRVQFSGATTKLFITTLGWIDSRGRLS